jgi:hypothetical protein
MEETKSPLHEIDNKFCNDGEIVIKDHNIISIVKDNTDEGEIAEEFVINFKEPELKNGNGGLSPIKIRESRNSNFHGNITGEPNEWYEIINKGESSPKNDGYSPTKKRDVQKRNDQNIKSAESSVYTVSKAPLVSCKTHGRIFIGVETGRFRLICKKCVQNGLTGHDLEMIVSNIDEESQAQEEIENENEDELGIECHTHPEVQGTFYCEDCKVFLCKICFGNIHRKHNSNLPKHMANSFKDYLKLCIDEMKLIKPKIDEGLERVKFINVQMKDMKEHSVKKVKNSGDKILSVHNKTIKNFNEYFSTKIFEGLDSEIDSINIRLSGLHKKACKFFSEIEEVSKKINKEIVQGDPVAICEYKQSKATLIKEILKVINDSSNLLNFKIEKITKLVNSKLNIFFKNVETLVKSTKTYEKSLQCSISSGLTNNSFVLRRFKRFSHGGLKYFKQSAVFIKVDSEVFIVGLALCGLYLSSKKIMDPNSNLGNFENRGQIKLELKISEARDDISGGNIPNFENKIVEQHPLFGIVLRNDPTFLIYLNKGVKLKPNTIYLLTIQNMQPDPYTDLWCGNVSSKSMKSLTQTLTCNCTKVNFSFGEATGIETDFNEFNIGIIEGLIYSKFN